MGNAPLRKGDIEEYISEVALQDKQRYIAKRIADITHLLTMEDIQAIEDVISIAKTRRN